MQLTHAYAGASRIRSSLRGTDVSFAPDLSREPTFFRGQLARPVTFRDALAALYDVVVSDLRYQPKSRPAYEAWLAEQDRIYLDQLGIVEGAVKAQLDRVHDELAELFAKKQSLMAPFEKAKLQYFQYLYKRDYDAWLVLDPIITVAPDELFFECFSKDESTYAKLGVRYSVFERVDEMATGTTNVDFSLGLHRELQRMRTYRRTRFEVDPGGFEVATDDAPAHHEKKIDLPDSWLAGLLQVQSAMTLGPSGVALTPIDLYDIIGFLKGHKARVSPRWLLWKLTPGERTRVVFEPWKVERELSPATVYHGEKPREVKMWGRDRLKLLERLLPGCRAARVHLLADGMPSFITVDQADVSFTLGMSAWTRKQWADEAKHDYHEIDRMEAVSTHEIERVFEALRTRKRATLGELAGDVKLEVDAVRNAASRICQSGRGIFDLVAGAYRHRELFREPLPWSAGAPAVR